MSAEGAGGSPGPWTGDGRCLIAWGSGTGPTFAADPEGKPIKEKLLGTCEVWRAIDSESGGPAVCIGETDAEAFLDEHIANGSRATYWVMEKAAGGGLRQVGPTIDVEMPGRPGASADVTPPTPPDDLRARRTSKGNLISWLPSCDDESGVLAYLIYSANEHQPDAVLWVDEENDRIQKTDAHRLEWTDETTDANKPYIMRAIDRALNLSDPTGKAIPTPGKVREPVEPVVPVGFEAWNLAQNPRFHYNISDGWMPDWDFTDQHSGIYTNPHRAVKAYPSVYPPAPADAIVTIRWPYYGQWNFWTVPVPLPDNFGTSFWALATWFANNRNAYLKYAFDCTPMVKCYDSDGLLIGSVPLDNIGGFAGDEGYAPTEFSEIAVHGTLAEGTAQVALGFGAIYGTNSNNDEFDFMSTTKFALMNDPEVDPVTLDPLEWSSQQVAVERVDSVPGTDLPEGTSEALFLPHSTGGSAGESEYAPLPTSPWRDDGPLLSGDWMMLEFDAYIYGVSAGQCSLFVALQIREAGGGWQEGIVAIENAPAPLGEFTHFKKPVRLGPDCVSAGECSVYIGPSELVPGGADNADTYFCNVTLGAGPFYADGDTSGWEWAGAAHNSPSRTAT
jgi:hypothetical protein